MLYYPLVTPPRPVRVQALLYWDSIASIVPLDMPPRAELDELGDCYLPLSITEPGLGVDMAGLYREVVAVLEKVGPSSLQAMPEMLTGDNRLYYGKLPGAIEWALLNAGVAIQRDTALQVDSRILPMVLAIASKYLAEAVQTTDHCLITHTDRANSYQHAYRPIAGAPVTQSWLLDLSELLPIPDPSVPVRDVLKFRKNHEDERERFLRAMRKVLAQLRAEVDEPAIPYELRQELKTSLQEYAKARRARKWGWVKVSVYASVGVAASTGALMLAAPLAVGPISALAGLSINAVSSRLRAGPSTDYTYAYAMSKELLTSPLA